MFYRFCCKKRVSMFTHYLSGDCKGRGGKATLQCSELQMTCDLCKANKQTRIVYILFLLHKLFWPMSLCTYPFLCFANVFFDLKCHVKVKDGPYELQWFVFFFHSFPFECDFVNCTDISFVSCMLSFPEIWQAGWCTQGVEQMRLKKGWNVNWCQTTFNWLEWAENERRGCLNLVFFLMAIYFFMCMGWYILKNNNNYFHLSRFVFHISVVMVLCLCCFVPRWAGGTQLCRLVLGRFWTVSHPGVQSKGLWTSCDLLCVPYLKDFID